jgi:glycerol-3-phosphate acyltransferase PlsY
MINQILYIFIAYFIGSISFGILSSKIFNIKDPRAMGSKNPGATNVLRTGNKYAAVFTLLGDMLKATLVVGIALSLNFSGNFLTAAILAVLLGHMYPIFYKFKGGKGVATALGTLNQNQHIIVISVVLAILILFRHKKNIQNLINGTESSFKNN